MGESILQENENRALEDTEQNLENIYNAKSICYSFYIFTKSSLQVGISYGIEWSTLVIM